MARFSSKDIYYAFSDNAANNTWYRFLWKRFITREDLFMSRKSFIIKFQLMITWRNEVFYFPTNAEFLLGQRKRWNTSSSVVLLANHYGSSLVIILAENLTFHDILKPYFMKRWKKNLTLQCAINSNCWIPWNCRNLKPSDHITPNILSSKASVLRFSGKPTTRHGPHEKFYRRSNYSS